ncbi:MAG: hypothetical protein CBB68_01735 [Rhodospirillaceae bacterium TMED8]|jgi:hypothetical protein|nr:MAG: hypothetical protein CBB68_01735 [Rhodospirillaceae bacterium TMED8]|tara:strand:+ start:2914 stop:4359 length:1446 start_codon:yes stop_codon:yes gene_type:complete
MAQDANGVFSPSIGVAPQGVSINDNRRVFNFGERVAELNPAASPFFAYLSKIAKKPTDDPVFKFLEKRHQWQRRNFFVDGLIEHAAGGSPTQATFNLVKADDQIDVDYDIYGRKAGGPYKAEFITAGQMIAIEGLLDAAAGAGSDKNLIVYYRVTDSTQNSADTGLSAEFVKAIELGVENGALDVTTLASGDKIVHADNKPGQVIGSAWAEGDTAPEGWRDEFYSREGYCQIFKTAVPLFSGTSLATRYRGDANEYMRVYQEKLMEHKMDIENALLFGYGEVNETSTAQQRKTWGILPYTEVYGKVKTFTYASSGYDDFVDAMSDIFDAESGAGGSKMVLASRSIMNWLNKLGGSSFLGNTMASGVGTSATGVPTSAPYGVSLDKGQSLFNGVNVTQVDTLYGTLNFVMEPLLRGPWANHAIVVDLNNVSYRPLAGNGESRDTQILTNIQNNDVDGRKDMILTEAGLEIQLPETHAILKFS